MNYPSVRQKNEKRKYMSESQKDKLNQVKDKKIEIEVQTTRKVT